MVSSYLWYRKGHCVGVLDLHHFIDGFVFGLFFKVGELLNGELGHNIVNRLCLACHRGGFNPHATVST